MQRKKILLLADWYEPGYKAGGPIQSTRNFVSAMHEYYDISVLTSSYDLGAKKPYEGIPENQWIERSPGISIYYASPGSLTASSMEKLINGVQPDFLYLNSMYSYRFSVVPLLLKRRKKIKAQIILSPRGMLRKSAIQYKTGKKKLYISMLNLMGIPQSVWFHATDEQERNDIRFYFPKAKKIALLSNFSAPLPESLVPLEKEIDSLRCVYISRILPIKNIKYFLEVLKKVPDDLKVEFSVYGDIEDAAYWQEAQEIIKTMPPHIRVNYGGSLPHAEVIPTLEAHHIFVLPTLGENFGHAIFESWSAGRPALISDKTPWHFLKKQLTGWDLPFEKPQAWVNAVVEAGNWDQDAFNSWSRSSREFAERHVNQFNLKQEYLRLFAPG